MEEVLQKFDVRRSLSHKCCPFLKTTYKIVKIVLTFNKRFENLEELEQQLFDRVNSYNNVRIHGSQD